MHITIIGGGITGLAAAFYLQKKSEETGRSVQYTLLDASPRLGGKIVTRNEGGYVMEGGPDSFITHKPWGLQLCRDLGLADRLIPCQHISPSVYMFRKKKLIPLPHGFRLTVPTEFLPFVTTPLISFRGKLRMALDLVIPPRKDNGDESVARFIGRRLGREAVENFAGPLMAGIFVADPHRLSIQGTFPNFPEMEKQHGSLIRAMLKARHHQPAAATTSSGAAFISLTGGMQEMVNTLLDQLRGDLRINTAVAGIRRGTDARYEVETGGDRTATFSTDAIILALPAYETARLLEPFSDTAVHLLRQIRYVSTVTVSLAYRRADLRSDQFPVGFGFVIPESEQRRILACTCSSNKFTDRAPADGLLMRVFVGGEARQDLVEGSDEELLTLARAELAAVLGIQATPIHHAVFRWRRGNPQYDVGHLDRVAQLEKAVSSWPGLYIAGSAYRGIGIPDCIHSALRTADQILSNPKPGTL